MTSDNILRLLHKYKSRDLAYFIDIFDREFLTQKYSRFDSYNEGFD